MCSQREDQQTIYLDFNVTVITNAIWGLHISKYQGTILTY